MIELVGRHVVLAPLRADDAPALWRHFKDPDTDPLWDYLMDGPYRDESLFTGSILRKSKSEDPFYLSILDPVTEQAMGHAAYMRMEPTHRVIEVGSILYSPALQRTTAATEAMYLMARHAFENMGYRRYEWKCNALNQPSRRAALRLGFTFEGIFRQHMIVKDLNRDTAWYSMLDGEWPARKIEFERWLHPTNFDADGSQLTGLAQR